MTNKRLEENYFKNKIIAYSINKDRIMPSSLKCIAIFMDRNRVVTIGMNRKKTHPLIKKT